MADAIGSIKETVGGFAPNMGSVLSVGKWLIFASIFLAMVGLVTYIIVKMLKYKYKIIIWEKVGGKFQATKKDRAMDFRLGKGGDTIFFLRRHRKFLPNPELQTGKRTYYYFIREDGEWINFEPGDFDEDARKMGAHMLHREARFARTQVQKGLKERYDEPGFWKQYGLLTISLGFILVIGIMAWLSLDKFIDIISTSGNILEKAEDVMKEAERIMVAMDNICTGGSGLVPAG